LEAMKGPKEKILFLPCIVPGKQDYLAVVDVESTSPTYSAVISRTLTGDADDELHHTGWNACSSCHDDPTKSRRFLVAPALKSGNIYIFDTQDERSPKLHHVVKGSDIREKTGLSWPHSTHCLGNGEVMISHMGDGHEKSAGNFLLLDGETFAIKGKWAENDLKFGYDFWYKPRHNIMVSTEWGEPAKLKHHFNPAHVAEFYGHHIHFWDWTTHKLIKSVDLGTDGLIPLETRFLHEPTKPIGFVGAALSSSVILIYKDDSGEWQTKKVIQVPPKSVTGWALPDMPGLITDIIISLDDRFLYLSNWIQGDIRQYNIEDPHHPKLVGQLFLGGSIRSDGAVTLNDPTEKRPDIPQVKGKILRGGPQMIQLSLDGTRLYVTTSLFSAWDQQFYPALYSEGGQLLLIDVNTKEGGLSIQNNFLVDFKEEPYGPALAHEVRYPGGDCTSDIWL